jgi:Uma2 family endonuclease
MSHETTTEPLRFDTFEAYLDWEEQQPERYELHNGYVVAMAGATEEHNRIADNVATLLNTHYGLRGRCHAFRAEMKLRVGELQNRYPDVFVNCEAPGTRRFFDDARIVVEVLSAGSVGKDLITTLPEYTSRPSLEQYIIIDSRKRAVWSHVRQPNGRFEFVPAEDERIEISCEHLALSFDDVYAGTTLDTTASC